MSGIFFIKESLRFVFQKVEKYFGISILIRAENGFLIMFSNVLLYHLTFKWWLRYTGPHLYIKHYTYNNSS